MNTRSIYKRTKQSGFLLIEVLVTVTILAIGLLGVSAMQLISLKSGHAAIERGDIARAMSSMANRMRANTRDSIANAYDISDQSTSDTCAISPSPTNYASVASNDICLWMQDINAILGTNQQAAASIACDDNRVCAYSIVWHDNAGQTQLESDFEADRSYTYKTTVMF